MRTVLKLDLDSPVFPEWLEDCPLVYDWCKYDGVVYFADLNYEESEKANKPIFDLAFCATRAMNHIFLKRVEWDSERFSRWENECTW